MRNLLQGAGLMSNRAPAGVDVARGAPWSVGAFAQAPAQSGVVRGRIPTPPSIIDRSQSNKPFLARKHTMGSEW